MTVRVGSALATVAAVVGVATSALAAPPAPEAFFQPFLTHVRISPDGRFIAARVARGEKETIVVRGTTDSQIVPIVRNEDPHWRIVDIAWVGDDRILYEVGSFVAGTPRQRFFSVARQDGSRVPLGEFVATGDARLVAALPDRPGEILLGLADRAFEVNVATGKLSEPVAQRPGVQRWFADPQGQVRAAATAPRAPLRELFARIEPAGEFEPISSFDPLVGSGLEFGAFGGEPSELLVFARDAERPRSLRHYDLKAKQLGETLFAHPEFDLRRVLLGPDGHAIGVDWIADRVERHYFDAAAARLAQSVDLALGGLDNEIVASSRDGSRRLVVSSGPSTPPSFFLLEPEDQSLSELFAVHPGLDGVPLAPVEPIAFAARDGLRLHGYVTTPRDAALPAPAIVLVHDHSRVSPGRDWLRFDPLVQFLASRGFVVLQVNYRGSSGYGPVFERAGRDEWGLRMQTDLEDGVRVLVERGTVDEKRVGIFGHGFGGYAALIGIVRNPGFYAAAAAWGAPTDLAKLAREQRNDWGGRSEAPGDGWADVKRVSAASPRDHLEMIEVPVLLGHGVRDQRFPIDDALRFQSELELAGGHCELLSFEAAHAELTRDDDRAAFYGAVADFFARHLAKKSAPSAED